jgi:replication-associated recombination protein RarA
VSALTFVNCLERSQTEVIRGRRDRYSRDLTAVAREGKLDPVIGRAREIETTIEVLARRKKNNPVLIGEPGVGKTANVEGLAQRIVAKCRRCCVTSASSGSRPMPWSRVRNIAAHSRSACSRSFRKCVRARISWCCSSTKYAHHRWRGPRRRRRRARRR